MSATESQSKPVTVHLVRHGQATSNLAALDVGREAYKLEEHLDARLTALGREQARGAGRLLGAMEESVQLVLSSPLTRALSTADEAVAGVVPETVPRVILPLLRERLGVHPCDRRRPWSEIAAEHSPLWDARLVATDHDALWEADVRETDGQIKARAREAIDWLSKRQEDHVAVFAHSSFLQAFLNVHVGEKTYLENGQLRTVTIPRTTE